MNKKDYEDYWFNYVISENPELIKSAIREVTISSNDKEIHIDIYEENVPKKADNIVFIHGTSVYSRFYSEFLYALHKKGFRIFAPDLQGHGLSEGKRGDFTMKEFSQNIYEVVSFVLNNYGNNIAVMGSSLGGITTLYCLANDPRIKAGICHNAAIFNENAYKKIIKLKGTKKKVIQLIPFFAKVFPSLKLSVLLYLDFEKLAHAEFSERIEYLMEDKLLSLKYSLKSLRAQMREPLTNPIETIKTPVMILNGEHDYLFSVEYMTEIYNRLTSPKKKLEIINGASHLIFQENISEVLGRIVPWLKYVIENT